MNLEGKVAVVTGAGRGIGKAISLRLGRLGCRMALAARTSSELEIVQGEIQQAGGNAISIPTDLTRDDAISGLVDGTLKTWGAVDILVNNAGWGKRAPVVRAKIEEWDQAFKVNLRAPMMLSRLLLPTMIAKGEGAVINIGSVAGKSGEANAAAYAASKFGLIGFTQSLYEEVREYGIKVAVILPGFVDTPLIPPTRGMDRNKMIRPEDIAAAVVFVLTSSPACCPVEITVRPQKIPYR
ncbi:MAG TPA: SDR family oxidoreductase [Candidatus Binatia bacterium]|nr:SDR family oxidoreductase [Candidatus Binatia bacterium]